jgi:hypothetical protein
MPAVDSFVGEGLNPSPYKEVLAENERLKLFIESLEFELFTTRNRLLEMENKYIYDNAY